ncbi:MAG: hypothetical protein ACK5E4_08445 [Planctomycetia bacterium]
MLSATAFLIKLTLFSVGLGAIGQKPFSDSSKKILFGSTPSTGSTSVLKQQDNQSEKIKFLPDPAQLPVPSASEPLENNHASDVSGMDFHPGEKPRKWFKHKSKLSFHEPVLTGCESSVFEYFNVKIYEMQDLEVEPNVLIKPIYNALPFSDVEVSYREEKRKVMILVPVEKEEERQVLEWAEVVEETVDRDKCKKLVTKMVQVPTLKKIRTIEMVPQEFETVIKIPDFNSVQSSITVQTLTGVQTTVPQITTRFGVLPTKISGQVYTPRPSMVDFPRP